MLQTSYKGNAPIGQFRQIHRHSRQKSRQKFFPRPWYWGEEKGTGRTGFEFDKF